MSNNSSAVPVWVQIFLGLVTTITTILVAYINRPLPAPVQMPVAHPSPVDRPTATLAPDPSSDSASAADPGPAPPPIESENAAAQTKENSQQPAAQERVATAVAVPLIPAIHQDARSSLKDLVGVDIAIGDSVELLKKNFPNIELRQVNTVLLGTFAGSFINKVPGEITVRIESDKVTTVWFNMSHDGVTVRRIIDYSEEPEEKVRNEYGSEHSYSQANSLCSVTKGIRSELIKILGVALQFDEAPDPLDSNQENMHLKHVDFEKFYAKYKIGDLAIAGINLHTMAYVRNDSSPSGFIRTTTSARECGIAVVFNRKN